VFDVSSLFLCTGDGALEAVLAESANKNTSINTSE